jgi:hypothetical protein
MSQGGGGTTTDDFYDQCDVMAGPDGMEMWVKQDLFQAARENNWIFSTVRNNDPEGTVRELDELVLDDEIGIDEDYGNDVEDMVFPEGDEMDFDRELLMASAKIQSKYIMEFENDNVYIPKSNFCSISAMNKFLELQGRGKNILSTVGVSPYKLSYKKLLVKLVKTCLPCNCLVVDKEKKCSKECIDNKIKLYKSDINYFDDKNNFESNNEDKFRPAIYKCRVKDGKTIMKKYTKLKDNNTKLAIGLFYIDNPDKSWHAFVIKDKTKLCADDLKIRLSTAQPLNIEYTKMRKYVQKVPKEFILTWDCETYIDTIDYARARNGKVYVLYVYAVRGQLSNIKTRENIGPPILVTYKTTEKKNDHNVMERFFDEVCKICVKNKITEINAYAYNSSRFDSLFCTDLKNVKYGRMIKIGNTIKSASIESSGIKIKLLDLLPFCLSSLDTACKTFKTEIKKQKFEIANKTSLWYTINMNREGYNDILNLPKIYDILKGTPKKSCCKHHMYFDNVVIYRYAVEEARNSLMINNEKCYRCELVKAVKDIRSGYKDWMTYLKFDVDSLQSLIYKVEDMYLDIGFSITNFVGLPGVAFDVMHSYCYNLAKCYIPKDPSYIRLCREMYYGGRTIFFHSHWDSKLKPGVRWDSDQRQYLNDINEVIYKDIYDDYLVCLDMNSLYPSVMFLAGFPTGKPYLITPEIDWMNKKHYIVKVDVEIPNIRYAIHPVRQGGGLIYPSNQTITGTYNDVDLREMLRDGYKVVKFHHGVYFENSDKIFSNLVELLYNKRSEYKALHPDNPEQAKEYIMKIVLNAMYGKFAEMIRNETLFFDKKGLLKYVKKIFKGSDKWMYNCCKDAQKNLDYDPVELCKKAKVDMVLRGNQYMVSKRLENPRVSKPCYIAGYVTAYSRRLMNELIRKVGPENIFASDTDSLYMRRSVMDKADLKFTNDLGGFKNDYGEGNLITKARFLDIKRAYLEFSKEIKSEFLDKFGNVHPACIDPITEEVNKGVPYFAKTFKFKFTGLNFRDVKNISNALQPENRAISLALFNDEKGKKSLELYNNLMENMNALAEEFINRSSKDDQSLKEPIKFMIRNLTKLNLSIRLDNKEIGFLVTPEKRGQWINREYYSLGFDMTKEEKYIVTGDYIGELKRSFEKLSKISYGFSSNGYFRSNRLVIYPSYYKYLYLCNSYKVRGTRINFPSTHPLVKEFNEAEDQYKIIMDVGREFTDMVKNFNKTKIIDKDRYNYLCNLIKYFNNDLKNNDKQEEINILNLSDVIIDRRVDCKYPLPEKETKIKSYEKKVIDSDYYIYIEGEVPKAIDYESGYKIYYMQKDFKGKKQYYEPHMINVKQNPVELDETNLYPIIMVSDKYTKIFGNNNMDVNQTLKLYNTIKMHIENIK